MTESIHAFSLPLGPAQPGLTNNQIVKRKGAAYRIVSAVMPSSKHLMNSVLQERIEGDGCMLWLAFDLVETPQMHLLLSGPMKSAKHGLKSALNNLYADLTHLKEEAEATVIRIGELEAFSARLGTLSAPELATAIDSLSDNDWELWRLINARKGRRISIEFSGSGGMGITMPLFPAHIPEKQSRSIQFLVVAPARDKAEIRLIPDANRSEPAGAVILPKKMELMRPLVDTRDRGDFWFWLYVAEYRGLLVKAKVRVALQLSDLSPSHLELLEILNSAELQVAVDGVLLRAPA